jgi:hypothetical protein
VDIDAVFKDVAIELIDNVFPTKIKYLQTENPTYDPATGQTVPNVVEYDINAGVLSSGLNEGGGTDGEHQLRLWIHHYAAGMPKRSTTADRVLYMEKYWKVVKVDPQYHSKELIASKIILRAE